MHIKYTKYTVIQPTPTVEMYYYLKAVDGKSFKAELYRQRDEEIKGWGDTGSNRIIKWVLIVLVTSLCIAGICDYFFNNEAITELFLVIAGFAFMSGGIIALTSSSSATEASFIGAANHKVEIFLNFEKNAKKANNPKHFFVLLKTQNDPEKAYVLIFFGFIILLVGFIIPLLYLPLEAFVAFVGLLGASLTLWGCFILYNRSKKISEAKQ